MAETIDLSFAYDTNDQLDIWKVGEEVFDGIAVHDISFLGATGRRIDSYLVTSVVGRAFPGVLLIHPLSGNRESFLNEALKLAERRICSLSMDAPWSGGMDWATKMGNPEHDRKELIETIRDLRRSFDVLIQSIIDVGRLGYIGHCLCALCDGVLSSIDRRARACVLMSETTVFSDVAKVNMPNMGKEELTEYSQAMLDIAPVRFVPLASPARFMFQMGNSEEYFNRHAVPGGRGQ
jgi:hypothetical protein